MTVLVRKSVCVDCIWKCSCSNIKKIDGIRDRRDNPGHINDIFKVVVIQCSMKNYDRSYKGQDIENRKLYYCTECGSMHHSNSRIGIKHKET